jgi:hypothetical protein
MNLPFLPVFSLGLGAVRLYFYGRVGRENKTYVNL